jgi:hypothetical protein
MGSFSQNETCCATRKKRQAQVNAKSHLLQNEPQFLCLCGTSRSLVAPHWLTGRNVYAAVIGRGKLSTRRLSWRGCEGSPDRLPGVVHVVGQACGNAPAGNDRSRIGRLAADPRPPRGEVAVDDVGVEGDDSVDTRSAHNLGRWCGGLDGQHGWPDGDRRRPPEQEKTYCASSEGRHFRHLPSVCRRRICSAYSCDQAHQAGGRLDVWARACLSRLLHGG